MRNNGKPMPGILRSTNIGVFILRMLLVYAVYILCRVVFIFYNADLVGAIPWGEIPSLIKGSLVFDSASILYVNLPFIFFSLIPFHFREGKGYRRFLLWLFLIGNGVGLMVNIADIFYYPFKLSRITSDDLHFLGEGNFGLLMGGFLKEYWRGIILWIVCMTVLYIGFRKTRFEPVHRNFFPPPVFFITQTILLGIVGAFSIFAIRGFSLSKAAFPLTVSDASLYVKPQYASVVLSNPFCLIRTYGQKIAAPQYFAGEEADMLYPVAHPPLDSVMVKLQGQPNIMFIILESFGSAHLKSFSDQFADGDISYTPFLDSLAGEGYVFPDAFQNGQRSQDALPAIWASIPSFKTRFLTMPQSLGEYKALPSCLAEMGYATLFFHGAVRESMSFVSFGRMAGIQQFYSREDYEKIHGTGDFDGKWGIWDHKFLPFVNEKLSEVKEPFFATLFTLSSHHPFVLPAGMEDRFPEGKAEIQKVIAYSDDALRRFFQEASREKWFSNTLFVLTADHGSGADNDKFRQMPYLYAVPILFYHPDGSLKGRHERVTQHIDLMPTLLRMIGYPGSFFAFGKDAFNDPDAGSALNHYGGTFNCMRDSMRYVFNEKEVVGVYNYKKDFFGKENITNLGPADSLNIDRMKAFIQQYYGHVKRRNYAL